MNSQETRLTDFYPLCLNHEQPQYPKPPTSTVQDTTHSVALRALNNPVDPETSQQSPQSKMLNGFKNWINNPSHASKKAYTPLIQAPDHRFVYIGGWINNMPNGYGELQSTRTISKGNWKDGKQHGKFEIMEIATKTVVLINFDQGKLVIKNSFTVKKVGKEPIEIPITNNGIAPSEILSTAKKNILTNSNQQRNIHILKKTIKNCERTNENNTQENTPDKNSIKIEEMVLDSGIAPKRDFLFYKNPLYTNVFNSLSLGAQYIGETLNNNPHGSGTLTLPDGRRFTGTFFEGMPKEPMNCCYQNGDIYVGKINTNWEPDGEGFYLAKKFSYVGSWVNGKLHGRGSVRTFFLNSSNDSIIPEIQESAFYEIEYCYGVMTKFIPFSQLDTAQRHQNKPNNVVTKAEDSLSSEEKKQLNRLSETLSDSKWLDAIIPKTPYTNPNVSEIPQQP